MSNPFPHAHDKSGYLSRGYLSEDSIAALATGPGGAINVIRVSGPSAFAVLDRVAQPRKSGAASKIEPRKMSRVGLQDLGGAPLDDALIVRFVGPDSFTGEDTVEFHLHGGSFIATRLMEVLGRLGVRQALPGEFSFRAVRNGKISLSQAQAVADLISAANDGAVSLALEKLSGSQNQLILGLATGLRRLATLGEVGIDFADQDLDEVSLPALKAQVDSLVASLERLESSYEKGLRLQDGVTVAFVGLPNAGKSSFFNTLLGEDRSIVSDIAGTTRDIVCEKITLRDESGSVTLRLEDTAGLRPAHSTNDEIEKIGIQRTHRSARDADLLLLIVDGSKKTPGALEAVRDQWASLKASSSKTIGIVTKSDLLSSREREDFVKSLTALSLSRWIVTSSVNGEGIPDAIRAIISHCGQWTHREKGELVLTRLNQVQAVSGALEHLRRAKSAVELDLFASDVRQALHSLAPLIGETVPDDILGTIFSSFCIGK